MFSISSPAVDSIKELFRTSPKVLVVSSAFMLVSAALSWRSFMNPDLGWHIASGLWMIDNLEIIGRDPFGADGAFWHDYSWSYDILLAALYRLGGFRLLQFVQFLLGVGFAAFFIHVVNRNFSLSAAKPNTFAIACLLLILCCSPIWYLRPQFLSLFFFLATLMLAKERRMWSIPGGLMLLAWVNIHIFWVFYPFIFAVYSLFDSRTPKVLDVGKFIILCFFGFLTPYGLLVLQVIYDLIFSQGAVYQGVLECARMTPELGYLFWLWLGIVTYGVCSIRTSFRRVPGLTLLFTVFSVLSFLLVRMLPFLGILAAFLLLEREVSGIRSGKVIYSQNDACRRPEVSFAKGLVIFLLLTLLLLISFLFALEEPPIIPRYQVLKAAAEAALESVDEEKEGEVIKVLNHFNDGGFLQLFFYEARPRGSTESRLKTLVDSRTVMAGEGPIKDFTILESLSPGWCEVLASWDARIAILPRKMRLAVELDSSISSSGPICGKSWRKYYDDSRYQVFLRIEDESKLRGERGEQTR